MLLPKPDVIVKIIEAKLNHAKECPYLSVYELSNIATTVRCKCGWTYTVEMEEEANDG